MPPKTLSMMSLMVALAALPGLAMADRPDHDQDRTWHGKPSHAYSQAVTVGPRPLFLVDDMADSPLKRRLASCENRPMRRSAFSIGHRAARPCSFRNTPASPTLPRRAWVPASSNAT